MKKKRKRPEPGKSGKFVTTIFEFDDAMRRAVRVKQPGRGTNQDYVEANKRRAKTGKP